ncbi:hypothetical protein GPECTOR_119g408 [Gonium pectorale]|uniref:phytol kinase n=1 Tax=Gonium pectorale TaxID=33097 RepID=A0A150FYW8_GONPE|nr:hypothetical protein GPECTOR_119g408 [Gonium pectorale]|eukprot:KXZ42777.1 hypothetical protein GPECTOR_119g408 [Gonium pectorale]
MRPELVYESAQLCITAVMGLLLRPDSAAGRIMARTLHLALLRSKAFHSASRQLAVLLDSADSEAVDAAAPAEAEGPAANPLVQKYTGMVWALVHNIIVDDCFFGVPLSPGEERLLRQLCAELVAALEESWVLEHAARALLLRHAARCIGLAVLCDADGGSAYGLPPELLALLTPRHEGAGGSGPAGGEMSDGAAKRLLCMEELFPLAAEALHAAWRFLSLPRAVAHAASGAAVAEAADWWRLAVAVVDRAVPCATGDAGRLALLSLGGERLAVAWGLLPGCGVLSLPAEPPPALAAALDGGLLPCLERLMRRAGPDPQGPEATLLQALVRRVCQCQSFWLYLAPLMAYGEPRQAAALLATLGKLLRTVDPRVLGAEDRDSTANSHSHDRLIFAVGAFLTTVKEQDEAAREAAPGDGPPSPASQQLLRLLSCAACEWLPQLSQLLSQPLLSSGMANSAYVMALLAWLPLLAGRCTNRPCAPGARSPPEGEACGEARGGDEAADAGGWRALLMEEVRAVALLDASLRMVPRVVTRGLRWPAAEAAAGRPEQQRPGDAAEAAAVQAPAASAVAGPLGATAAGAPAAPPLPRQSGLLREAAAGLRSCGDGDMAAHAEDLAAYVELGGSGACEALRQAGPPPGPLVAALPPPTEARRLLPGRCANPRCANLEGDSEAGLTLKSCEGCGAVGYCCRPCQLEHWRAMGGHKGMCARVRGGGGR